MPFITLEELIKELTDEYVQKQRTPGMLDEFMSEGWRTRIPRNDDDDEDHRPIIIEFCGRIDAVTDSDSDEETPYSSQKKKKPLKQKNPAYKLCLDHKRRFLHLLRELQVSVKAEIIG